MVEQAILAPCHQHNLSLSTHTVCVVFLVTPMMCLDCSQSTHPAAYICRQCTVPGCQELRGGAAVGGVGAGGAGGDRGS